MPNIAPLMGANWASVMAPHYLPGLDQDDYKKKAQRGRPERMFPDGKRAFRRVSLQSKGVPL